VINDLELRIALNRRLNMPVSDAEWGFLDSQGWAREIRCGRLPLDGAAEKIQQMRRAFGNAPPQQRDKNGLPPDQRLEALAAVIATEIITATSSFRAKHLGGQFLAEDQLPAWFEQQRVNEPSWIGEFYVSSPGDPRPADTPRALRPLSIEAPYPGPTIPVCAGTILDQLRLLSEHVAQEYRIGPAEACRTILTGLPPRMEAIRIVPCFSRLPAVSRFQIEVDPAVTPSELARAYRNARKKYLKGRVRRLSAKHLQLAAFMASRAEGEPGKDAMAAWNRKYRRWKYTHVSNFLRDAAAARRRLLFPGGLDIHDWRRDE
jgi:hypothetical protein